MMDDLPNPTEVETPTDIPRVDSPLGPSPRGPVKDDSKTEPAKPADTTAGPPTVHQAVAGQLRPDNGEDRFDVGHIADYLGRLQFFRDQETKLLQEAGVEKIKQIRWQALLEPGEASSQAYAVFLDSHMLQRNRRAALDMAARELSNYLQRKERQARRQLKRNRAIDKGEGLLNVSLGALSHLGHPREKPGQRKLVFKDDVSPTQVDSHHSPGWIALCGSPPLLRGKKRECVLRTAGSDPRWNR